MVLKEVADFQYAAVNVKKTRSFISVLMLYMY